MKKAALLWSCCVLLIVRPASAVVFNFIFDDVLNDTNLGFDDPSSGALRQTTLTSFINSTIGASLAGSATIDIKVNNSLTSGTGFLASAGPLVPLAANSFQGGLVYSHITTGIDPSGSNPDGVMTWNFGYDWAINTNPTGGQVDFRSVALHELTHALGFLSFIESDGASSFGSNVYSKFDSFLKDSATGGTLLINPSTFAFQGTVGNLVDNVYFTGANAVSVYGTGVPLYTPASFADGSSLSHWDDIAGLSDKVMSYSINPGEVNRAWSALEVAALTDLGYTFAVPEPADAALIVAAVAALGGLWQKRRKQRQ